MKPAADLGALLQRRFAVRINVSEAAARAAVSRYEGEEIIDVETQQDQKRKQQIAEARKKFWDGPVLLLSLTDDVRYSYEALHKNSGRRRRSLFSAQGFYLGE